MNKNLKCIGTSSKNYAHKRLILDKLPEIKYKDVRFLNVFFWTKLHLWISKYYLGFTKMNENDLYIKLFLKFKIIFPKLFKVDLLHFFNVINFSNSINWVVSIETCLPHIHSISTIIESPNPDFKNVISDTDTHAVLKKLSMDNCKGLLAISECTKNIQLEVLKVFPEYEEKIKKKLIVIHPPQKLLVNSIKEKGLSYTDDEILRFIFIGKDFFRKGGNEVLTIFKEFKVLNKSKFELTIISDINNKENFSFISDIEVENALKVIGENSDWIRYFKNLPNESVLDYIKKSHVALLPTWMDTYGYSVLECQASGCPVITTDIRALSEINNNEIGWIIKFPTNHLKHPLYPTEDEFKICREIIEDGLRIILEGIFEKRQNLKQMAESCLKNISTNHNPEIYGQKLRKVYNACLG